MCYHIGQNMDALAPIFRAFHHIFLSWTSAFPLQTSPLGTAISTESKHFLLEEAGKQTHTNQEAGETYLGAPGSLSQLGSYKTHKGPP